MTLKIEVGTVIKIAGMKKKDIYRCIRLEGGSKVLVVVVVMLEVGSSAGVRRLDKRPVARCMSARATAAAKLP